MNKGWEKIFSSTQLQQAEIMKAILAQNEIECVLMNKQDSMSKFIGEIQLFVKQDDVLRAIQILNKSQGE